jgi:hypothetical protein
MKMIVSKAHHIRVSMQMSVAAMEQKRHVNQATY